MQGGERMKLEKEQLERLFFPSVGEERVYKKSENVRGRV